jgi:hypothetical protein
MASIKFRDLLKTYAKFLRVWNCMLIVLILCDLPELIIFIEIIEMYGRELTPEG